MLNCQQSESAGGLKWSSCSTSEMIVVLRNNVVHFDEYTDRSFEGTTN